MKDIRRKWEFSPAASALWYYCVRTGTCWL